MSGSPLLDLRSPAIQADVLPLLREVREALGMQIAFVSRFSDGRRVFEAVDATCPVPFGPGDSDAAEDTYCQRIVDGRLPQAIPDTARNPVSAALPVTTELSVGSHVGAAIVLPNGTVYGTICAYSDAPRPVDERDAAILVLVARTLAQHVSSSGDAGNDRADIARRLAHVLDGELVRCDYQPLVQLASGELFAVEALARFPPELGRRTDQWFGDAALVGESTRLELTCIRTAVEALAALPSRVALSVNVSGAVLCADAFAQWLATAPIDRLVLELTEHDAVADYEKILSTLADARAHGLRLAVDDAGAGYASMRHALLLKPEILKLDISLVRDVDADSDKRSLCRAIITFAKSLGTKVVAEGVETAAELFAVRALGVDYAQGYHLARPSALDDVRLGGYRSAPARRVTAAIRPDTYRLMHEMTLAGASAETIAARLNQLGERTPRGTRWRRNSVEAAYLLCPLRSPET